MKTINKIMVAIDFSYRQRWVGHAIGGVVGFSSLRAGSVVIDSRNALVRFDFD